MAASDNNLLTLRNAYGPAAIFTLEFVPLLFWGLVVSLVSDFKEGDGTGDFLAMDLGTEGGVDTGSGAKVRGDVAVSSCTAVEEVGVITFTGDTTRCTSVSLGLSGLRT